MNHLIDWCQVSSISALFLTELLLHIPARKVSGQVFVCWL
jgi:hypothetical protein